MDRIDPSEARNRSRHIELARKLFQDAFSTIPKPAWREAHTR